MDGIIQLLTNFSFTSLMGIYLYWAPLTLCAWGYTLHTWQNYQKDIVERDKYYANPRDKMYYSPTDTIGTLIGRAIVTFMPVANLWVAVLGFGPRLFSGFFRRVGKIFDIPLVPVRKVHVHEEPSKEVNHVSV